jgi:geranylgeranyl diphosphate synthase, type I
MKNAFTIYNQQASNEIEKELKKISQVQYRSGKNDFPDIKALQKRFTQSWFGGKMLRGTLVKLGYELVSGYQTKAIFKPACAFEILHTSLLIHDDIIDKSPTRRGKPALHMHENNHYGVSQAICLGDLGISLSGKVITESDFPKVRKNKALGYFFEIVQNTILGEMMDVANAQKIKRTEKEVLQIHTMKTANYTLVGPLLFGAILAGATDTFLKKIKLFAQPLGVAYQIQDDILGIFGNEKELGKSITSDIEENKSTLLITYVLKQGNKTQKNIVTKLYGKKSITKKECETIKKIFIETGAFSYSQNKIAKLTAQAKKQIPYIAKNDKMQILLMQFADSLIVRIK